MDLFDYDEDYGDEYQETMEEKFYHYGSIMLVAALLIGTLFLIL